MNYNSHIHLLGGMDKVMRPLSHAFLAPAEGARRQARNAADRGLLRFWVVRARQLMGLHGLHSRNTGTVNPQSAAQPVREGLHKIARQVVIPATNRANRGDFRALGPFTHKREFEGPEGADTLGITLARTMDKRFSVFKEFDK